MRICFFGSISRSSCLPRSRISGRITHRAARGPTTPLFTPELSLPHPLLRPLPRDYPSPPPLRIPYSSIIVIIFVMKMMMRSSLQLSLTWRESSLACREKNLWLAWRQIWHNNFPSYHETKGKC
ncbi:hypothetical protein CDAR_22291 [Caerostris darwini]|uniref:Uncharacterized protein n=1 Tax=Caerostris darwini TaxID=1538125 RepID=A0AAV4USW3_9ARAC|nr:hypothetical protein CDAR_22291 [Caerostris darwini]